MKSFNIFTMKSLVFDYSSLPFFPHLISPESNDRMSNIILAYLYKIEKEDNNAGEWKYTGYSY